MHLNITYALKIAVFWLSSLFIVNTAMGQATITRTIACSCIDNNAPQGNAQFMEEITVSSIPGETWYISTVSGFYQLTSPVPPATQEPFEIGPAGETLVADGDGNYTLEGLHLENLGYSITVTNGLDVLSLSNILCEYPRSEIQGDNAICGISIETYTAENFLAENTYEWDVVGNGTILGSSTGNSINVEWEEVANVNNTVFLRTTGPTGCSSTTNLSVEFESDITLACNDMVNIAVSTNCIISISADDILEDMNYNNDSYEITITNPETGEVINDGDLASPVLFDTLEISILHLCSGNSCWGNIVFEDKYVPPLTCVNDTIPCNVIDSPSTTGFPLPSSATISLLGNNTYLIEDFDPCGDATLTFTDSEEPLDCSMDFGSIKTRTFILTDFSGYTTSCNQLIYKTRTTVEDVVFPGDYDGITNPILQCDGNFPRLPNGNPDPSFTGVPSGGICDHLLVSYTDLESVICGATFKVVRKWQIVDECRDTLIFENQLIKIEDGDAPSFNCPSNNLSFPISTINSCDATVTTPVPSNVYDCSDYEFSATIVKIDDFGNIAGTITDMVRIGGNFVKSQRTLGRHRITYTAVDECGNESSCNFTVRVVDAVEPIAVCDLNTTIAIDNSGTAIVPVSTFDNGSYDNCGVDKIEISRGQNACGAFTGFSDNITLCCEDVNTEVMVTLKVTDNAGNVNTCMVMVMVQDKKVPIIDCPANQTISCTEDYSDLSVYGTATASDNCTVTVEEDTNFQINSCGLGTIFRTFTATDNAGNIATCTQVINVVDYNEFDENDISWPLDYTTSECITPALMPEDLPFINSFPQIANNACSNVSFDFDDKVFTNVNGTCKSIFRTWTVIDQCTNEQFTYIQKIHVIDNTKPQFTECSNKVLQGTSLEDCLYEISYTKEATDECTAPEDIYYEYSIDINDNGGADITGDNSTLTEILPAGIHRVSWVIRDDCNNFQTCTEYITINDEKQPTPYCLGGISTVIMPSTGTISVLAESFNVESTDNCTSPQNLVFSFSENPTESSMVFTCADLEGTDEMFFTLPIYAHDEAGNFDFCSVTVRITANNGSCDPTGMLVNLDGSVKTDDGEVMENVKIDLTDITQNESFSISTDESGAYSFINLDELMNYSVSASYVDAADNGITTLDIVLIQKHILGIELFDSPYKVIAADVDNNEKINGIDIVQLRKLLLGFYDEFPANDAWVFVDAKQEFASTISPWPYNSTLNFTADTSKNNLDFVSVKVGDVNNTRGMQFQDNKVATRNNDPVEFLYSWVNDNGNLKLKVELAESIEFFGYQLALETSLANKIIGVKGDGAFTDNNISTHNDLIKISFSEAFAQKVSDFLFEINFGPTSPQQITIDVASMAPEFYAQKEGRLELQDIVWREKDSEEEAIAFKVYQNSPNPFSTSTRIDFDLPQEGEVKMELRTLNGVLVMTQSARFPKGRNAFDININDINYSKNNGILIYTIFTNSESVTGKMVAIQ